MKKNFDYIQDDLLLYCYKGKNQVIELEFKDEKEIKTFISAIDNYQETGILQDKDLLEFFENNPEYGDFKITKKHPTFLVLGTDDKESLIKKIIQRRGFKDIEFITSKTLVKTTKKSLLGLNIKTNKTNFKKNTKFFLDNNIDFISVDLDQGCWTILYKKRIGLSFLYGNKN
jgi:hypothetical protein